MVLPGDSHFLGCFSSWTPHVHCLLWPLCFYGFSTSIFKCPHECLPRLIHLCLFLDWCPASGPDSAMCLPYLGGIPVSAGFPGIPLPHPDIVLPFSLSCTRTWRDAHTYTHKKGYSLFIPIQARRKWVEEHKLVPLPLSHMNHTGSCFLGDHSGSQGKLITDKRTTLFYSLGPASCVLLVLSWKLLGPWVVIVVVVSGTECTGPDDMAQNINKEIVIVNNGVDLCCWGPYFWEKFDGSFRISFKLQAPFAAAGFNCLL